MDIGDEPILTAIHYIRGTEKEVEAVCLILFGLTDIFPTGEVPWTLRKVHAISDSVFALLPGVELTTIETFRSLVERAGL